MMLPVKLHTHKLERQRATPSSTEYQDGGQDPEVVITWQFSVIILSLQI